MHLKDRLPLTLSFGEQHRVALASVIAPNPELILLDEPFAGLDPTQRLRLLTILARLREERGTAIVIASHDPLPDMEWADRVITMQNGRIALPEEAAIMRRRAMGSDYACQYRVADSLIHRLPAGWKMLVSTALSILILVVREPLPLLLATALCFLYYFLARLNLGGSLA